MRASSSSLFKKVCVAICAILIAGDVAFALYVRASQTDYGGAQQDSMESLPYRANPVSVKDWSADIDGMDLASRIDQTKDADVIIRASLDDDNKDVGYGAILASVRVLEVYRGDFISPGDCVTIIEPYEISELSQQEMQFIRDETPDDYDALLDMLGISDGDEIHVMQPNGEPYVSGTLPISESGEYLMFLDVADSHLARDSDAAALTYISTPFSCLSLRSDESSEIWERGRYVPVDTLNGVSFLAIDAETNDRYQQIAADMLAYAEEQSD